MRTIGKRLWTFLVLAADFYRAGDGNDESFTAPMIVSTDDIAPDVGGVQNVWIQGGRVRVGDRQFQLDSLKRQPTTSRRKTCAAQRSLQRAQISAAH
jgi:hypothetical protein